MRMRVIPDLAMIFDIFELKEIVQTWTRSSGNRGPNPALEDGAAPTLVLVPGFEELGAAPTLVLVPGFRELGAAPTLVLVPGFRELGAAPTLVLSQGSEN